MQGIIKIKGFKIHCIVGAHPHERNSDQELLVDVEMRLNLTEPVQTDSIVDTVDYDAVCQVCKELAQTRRYHLLETFAFEALHAILDTFPISWAKVSVRKSIPLAKHAAIEFEKEK